MVPEVGLEPTQCRHYQILSLARLPISPLRRVKCERPRSITNLGIRSTENSAISAVIFRPPSLLLGHLLPLWEKEVFEVVPIFQEIVYL